MHGQIQRVVWGLPDWWVKLLRTRLPKRGHLLVFRQNWTKPYLEVWVCLVLSALNLCFVSIIVSPSVWCDVRNQRRSNCSQFWDLGFYSDYVCLWLTVCPRVCLSVYYVVCVLGGLSNNRRCFNFGLAWLVPGCARHIFCWWVSLNFVMWQRWRIWRKVSTMAMVMIPNSFPEWRVRPSRHSHTLSLSLSPCLCQQIFLSLSLPFSSALPQKIPGSHFPILNTADFSCNVLQCKV